MSIGGINMNKNEDFDVTKERIKELKGDDSQEIFAKKINMTQSNVSKLLGGTPPSASTLIAISRAYDVSVDWLLGLSDRKSKKNFPSLDNITYADALAVFDRLIEMDSIFANANGDPSMFRMRDGVLNYLLTARLTVENVDIETRKYWYKTMAEQFAEYKLLKWKTVCEEVFDELVPNKPEATDIVKFLNVLK